MITCYKHSKDPATCPECAELRRRYPAPLPMVLPEWRPMRITAEIEHRLSGRGSFLWFVYVDGGEFVLTQGFEKTLAECQRVIRERWSIEPRIKTIKAYVKKAKNTPA